MADSLYQSVVVFWLCKCAYEDTDVDIFEFGTAATTACMCVMLLHVSIETRSWVSSYGNFYSWKLIVHVNCRQSFMWHLFYARSEPFSSIP